MDELNDNEIGEDADRPNLTGEDHVDTRALADRFITNDFVHDLFPKFVHKVARKSACGG